MIIYSFDFSFVKTFYIFSDVFFVVFEKLLLNSKCTTEILVIHECLDDFRHAANCHIIAEKTEENIYLKAWKRLHLSHAHV